jgi:adenosine deaminase
MSFSSEIQSFLCELPKCEHHVHLEGTLSAELLFQLAKKNNIVLPADFPSSPKLLYKRYDEFTSLDDFLHFYYIGMSSLITIEDFENLAWQYFVKAKNDGVVHAEVSFDPQVHIERAIDFNTVVKGFTNARSRAQNELGLSTKLIMCMVRHLPIASGIATVHKALPYFKSGEICGIGLDSTEKNNPPSKYEDIYTAARELNVDIRYTIHAGEEGSAEYVREAISLLKVERIDHGISAADDPGLLKLLAASKTLLTVCPLSNLKLRAVKDIGQVPLKKFLDAGVQFSINCDDPAYFGGYILDNYKLVHEKFQFDVETWCKISEQGIRGSWISNDEKENFLKVLKKTKQKYEHIAI